VLGEAIRTTHGGEPHFVEAVPVNETFEGQTVWDGIVHVFDLKGHPTATRAYAWSEQVDGVRGRQRFHVVLHQGPVDSPVAAVRAAIVRYHRGD